MAEFEAKVYRLTIEEHPNADAIELARVGDYLSIVKKGQFQTGDLGIYIPEAAVCPDWVITDLGLEGRLAGKQKNRVKAIKLRGILSQGLIYPLERHPDYKNVWRFPIGTGAGGQLVELGQDVTKHLELVKWEPPIPVHMTGEVFNCHGKTLGYDIENIKKYPHVLQEGEDVIMTEKIHGTWCCFGYHPLIDIPIVTSKGLSAKGLAFKFNEQNENNLYVRAFQGLILRDINYNKLFEVFLGTTVLDRISQIVGRKEPFYLLGEIFGQGVQDLHYGATTPEFRMFDIYVGSPGTGKYMCPNSLSEVSEMCEINMVPTLYKGPFSHETMLDYTSGTESVSGKHDNIREGIVIKPLEERRDDELGRVVLKSVSERYILRKKGTEFN